MTLRIERGDLAVTIDPDHGARLASLCMGGTERLVTAHDDTLRWGAYPMVPFAGRVRDGVLRVGGAAHDLPTIADGHAIHGTVLDARWATLEVSAERVLLAVALAEPWPFAGEVTHEVWVDDAGVGCRLTVRALDPMPAQVGWHPWFLRPERLDVPFSSMLTRDARGIPDGTTIDTPPGPWDDCFVADGRAARLTWRDGWTIDVESDCSHVVVYDQPEHAVCVEPQSGPPNGVNDAPDQLRAGESLTRTMYLRVSNPSKGREHRP